jgi:hypothetical protein
MLYVISNIVLCQLTSYYVHLRPFTSVYTVTLIPIAKRIGIKGSIPRRLRRGESLKFEEIYL